MLDAIKAIATGIVSQVADYMEDWDPGSLPEGMDSEYILKRHLLVYQELV